MRMFKNRRFVSFVIICGLFTSGAFAQLNHFIYLQTDNQQPFYIKYNNRIISSSASGYLILPKLKDGVVEFALGFPKTNLEEQKFQCVIDKADKGFLVKNFNEKGWGLYDLQSSSVVYAQAKTAPETNTQTITAPPANDPFSNMLSKVTQDSTVKTVSVVKEPVVKPDTAKVTKPEVVVKTETPVQTTKDTVVKANVVPPVETKKEEAVVKKEEVVVPPVSEPEWRAPSKSAIKQIRKFESREGVDFVFEVEADNTEKDTVRLFIEKDTTQQPVVTPVVTPAQTEVKKDSVAPVVTEPVQPKKEEVVVKKEEVVVAPPPTEQTTKKEAQPLPNSNCKDFATEDDLIKLRRKMASQRKDEQMIEEAKKVFRNKCFTSAQLRNLSVAFLTDEGRYRFFDAALPYVTDFANFKSLGETIQDEYYKRRFMALLPNQ
ncbi:hypothetical protein ESA94_21225 [Lacibacter luteus]|uniref:DUF4476 domain-containing protein n=1 Tax=Lacibacter luteus TaxID=2508719 RepID=A0A4Q1CD84_9BACT|nr:DUF4476 domain-containing protein [Lacibacter luteus]RXK57387.1 hypothetical protein ESA94_21225 [Lacibacter luteus]